MLERLHDKVEAGEVYELRSRMTPVRFRAGELESAKSIEHTGRALRLIKDGRLGYSTTTDLEDEASLIKNALASAQFGDRASFQFSAARSPSEVACFDSAVENIEVERMIRMGEEAVEKIKTYDQSLHIEVSLFRGLEEVRLRTTNGQETEERGTSFALEIELQRMEEGDILVIHDQAASRSLRGIDPLKLADSLIGRLRWCEQLARVETKAMPVLFTPRGVLVLLLPLMVGLDGKNVHLGVSPLQGKLGEQAFDERITLIDDGTLPLALRSRRFDDEGVPTSQKSLIERGRIDRFLYDLKTAAMAEAESTGNGFKSGLLGGGDFKKLPGVAPATWVIGAGDESFEEMLENLEEGLIVDQVLGLGQGNIASGEFSNNVAVGFYVRGGEIVGRVKNTMIAGNVYELLKEKLIKLGSEAEWAYGLFKSPPLLVGGVSVIGQ